MARTDPRKNKLLINVGMNKGYNWAAWMEIFTPHNNVNAQKWGKLACANVTNTADAIAQCCGACEDCKVSDKDSGAYSIPNNICYWCLM